MIFNAPVQGFQNQIASSPNAILWIFTPRYFSHQAKRPLLYKFNSQFIDAAEEAVSRMSEQHDAMKLRILASSPHYLSSMTPSQMPQYMINMDPMSSSYTFMMVTNNDNAGIRNMALDNQQIYYGYFIGEPVNPLQHFGNITYNDQAVMMITHKTTINKHRSYSGGFSDKQRFEVMTDIDVLHPHTAGMMTAPNSILRPEDVYSATGDGEDTTISHGDGFLLQNQGNALGVTSKFSVPKRHIHHVLSAVAEARGSMLSDTASGGSFSLGRDTFRSLVEQHLADGTRLSDVGLAVNQTITLGSIRARFTPVINKIDLDYQPKHIPIDQADGSARNVFSSMLSSVIPALMANYMIMDIGFIYDSYTDTFRLFDGKSFATSVPMSQADQVFQINGLIHQLKAEVFPMLKMTRGEFMLHMQCSCGGMTLINLNFLDDEIKTKDVFDVPTILGGLNSPLLGPPDAFNQNALELKSLVESLVETSTDKRMSHYDDRRFGQALLSYDNTTRQPQIPQQPPGSSDNPWNI